MTVSGMLEDNEFTVSQQHVLERWATTALAAFRGTVPAGQGRCPGSG